VVAIDAATGVERWRMFTGGQLSDATVADGAVYVVDRYGELLSLDLATGSIRWSVPPGEEQFATAADGVVVIDGLAVSRFVDALIAFDALTGEERWRYDATADGGLAGDPAAQTDGS
jgi:outer membrane protein assembly factor BamB